MLCLELLRAMKRPLVEPNLYGRSGQSQHGVDFTLQLTDGLHGYQCKRVDSFTIDEFEAELAKTGTFPNPLRSWTVLATAPNDARLLDEVATLSLRRADSVSFPVTVVFWSTIRDWLADHPAVALAHYGHALGGRPRRPLTVEDHRELENLLARHERKRLSAAQVLGHLKAKGYATEKMADVYALVAEFDRAHPAPQPAPEPSFAERVRAHGDQARAREQRERDERAAADRARRLVEAGYDAAIRNLVSTCRRVVEEAKALLGEGPEIHLEREEDTSILATYKGFCICIRHHLQMFQSDAPYAQVVITRRRSWRREDVEQLGHPTIPLVAVDHETLAWKLNGRRCSPQQVGEWMVEELIRLGDRG